MRLLASISPLVLIGCLVLLGCGRSGVLKRAGEPDVVSDYDQALMDRAIAKARATVGDFTEALGRKKSGMSGFSVKKSYPTTPGDAEHIWLSDVTWNGTVFAGRIGNTPAKIPDLRLGDRASVTPGEISDWLFLEGGKLRGGYTLRVIYQSSPPEARAEMDRGLGFQVPPVDF